MKKRYYFILLCLWAQMFQLTYAQVTAPGIAWQKTLGGSGAEVLTAMAVGADKSILLCGYSNSNVSGNKSNASYGGYDYWLIKLDASGNVLWNKTYGGNDDDRAAAIMCTSDGGYLLGGSSVSGKSGNKTANAFEFSYDYWVLKLDVNGNIQWDKTLGGTYTDRLTSLAELPNGTFVVGGNSYSNKSGTKTTDNIGSWTNADYWTVILNPDGTEKTQHLFGGVGHDVLGSIIPVKNNGYYVTGYSYSAKGGGKNTRPYGNNDFYMIRSSATGKRDSETQYGGKLSDYFTSMRMLADSSLILGGYSNSTKGNTKGDKFYGVNDYWLLKLKKDGTRQWDKTISGAAGDGFGGDYLMSVQPTKDNGFILGGYSDSRIGGNKTANPKGGFDYWIVKVDSLGNVQWDKTIGGSGRDMLTAVYEIEERQYIIAGTSSSALSGDKTAGVIGGGSATDFWVLRLGATQSVQAKSSPEITSLKAENSTPGYDRYKLNVMPNPVKDILTVRYSAAANSKADFTVYASNGKAVLQSTLAVSNGENIKSFNVANLPGGSYFAVMYIGEIKLTKAFTKE